MKKFLFLFFLLPVLALAQSPNPGGMYTTQNTNGSRTYFFPSNTLGGTTSAYTVYPATGAMATAVTPITPITNNPNFAGFTFDAGTGGGTRVSGSVNSPVGTGGFTAPVEFTGNISRATILTGVALALSTNPFVRAALFAAPLVAQWLHDDDINSSPDGTGFTVPGIGGGTVSLVNGYVDAGTGIVTVFTTLQQACEAYVAYRVAANSPGFIVLVSVVEPTTCNLQYSWGQALTYHATVGTSCPANSTGTSVCTCVSGYIASGASCVLAPSTVVPWSSAQLAAKLDAGASPGPGVVAASFSSGLPLNLDTSPTLTGPGTLQGPVRTSTVPGSPGSPAVDVPASGTTPGYTVPAVAPTPSVTTTSSTVYNITYVNSTVTPVPVTTVSTTNNTSNVTTTVTTTPGKPSLVDQPITCGLPGTPACKLDETGTPSYGTPNDPTVVAKDAEIAKITTLSVAPALFTGWSALFDAPAVAVCTPFVLPRDYGSIDPCPVVDGVRSVMGYIWALTAMFLCLGMVKKAV